MVFNEDGTVSFDTSNARPLFYGDCSDQVVDYAAAATEADGDGAV